MIKDGACSGVLPPGCRDTLCGGGEKCILNGSEDMEVLTWLNVKTVI